MSDEILKLQAEILRDELKFLNTAETWGATLFLGAIALVSKQVMDWGEPTAGKITVSLQAPIFMLPALIGLVAFTFLRVVNSRIYRTRNWLYGLTKLSLQPPEWSFGIVGWLMAIMPLLLGYGATWYFALGKPEVQTLFSWLLAAAFIFVIGAVTQFVRVRYGKSVHPI